MVFLSADSAGNYTTGKHIIPTNGLKSYFNREYPTISYKPVETALKTEAELGGFFTPSHIGAINYLSVGSQYTIDNTLITEGIHEFPDPGKYGSDKAFVKFEENVEWFKSPYGNGHKAGDIVNDTHIPKFWSYQSKVETNKFDQWGVSRIHDNFDFWTGTASDVWANSDIYELDELNDFDLTTRQEDLLLSHSTSLSGSDDIISNRGIVSKWETDIFGNNFSLFKQVAPSKLPSTVVYTAPADDIHTLPVEEITYTCIRLEGEPGIPDFGPQEAYEYILNPTSGFDEEAEMTFDGGPIEGHPCEYEEEITYTCIRLEGEPGVPDFGPQEAYEYILNPTSGFDEEADMTFDGGPIEGHPCETEARREYEENLSLTIPFYETEVVESEQTQRYIPGAGIIDSNSLTTKHTIYDQRKTISGECQVRNLNHSIIDTFINALSADIAKYNSEITDDLSNIIDIDIIYDVLLIKTPSYKIISPLKYNYSTNRYEISNSYHVIQLEENEGHIDHFFNENTNKIILGKTIPYDETAYYIYPEIYEYDLNGSFRTAFNGLETLSGQLSDAIDEQDFYIDVSAFDVEMSDPIVTYNEYIERYYIGTTLRRGDRIDILKWGFDHKLDFIETTIFEDLDTGYTPMDRINSLTATLNEAERLDDHLVELDSYNTITCDLRVDLSTLPAPSAHEVRKVTINWGDGNTDYYDRYLADLSSSKLSPLQREITHTYKFTNNTPLSADVTLIDYNGGEEIFNIVVTPNNGNLYSVMGDFKLLELKSFVNNNTERTLAVLESEYNEIFQIVLNDEL